MTPKEALNNIATISEILVEVSKSHIMANEAINEIRGLDISGIYFTLRKLQAEHEALKKPPTADEVCKALSEQLKQKISYGAKQFYYTIENTECVMFVTETYGDGLWSINEYLPPHLITLIGRFYDGLEVKE